MNPLSRTCCICLLFCAVLHAQDFSQTKELNLSGNINITNNGFSFIPLFSLGKPATTVNLSVSGKRLSFDPQFRFDLDGMRPWSFLFVWHYKLIKKKRFQVRLGSYFPAYAFTKLDYTRNMRAVQVLTPQRFFIWTTYLNYALSKKVNLGLFYLNGRGLEQIDQTGRGNFITLRAGIKNVSLSKTLRIHFNPEIYFLKIDRNQGYYVAQTFSLSHTRFPLSLSTTMNRALNSNINAKTFDWNIGINYGFSTTYQKKKK